MGAEAVTFNAELMHLSRSGMATTIPIWSG